MEAEGQTSEKMGWLARMGSSLKGVIRGLVVVVIAFPLLFWNEGRAVANARRLAEGEGAVVHVPVDRIDPANEGKLVHASGRAEAKDFLSDVQFGISAPLIRLVRSVEIFQWEEGEETVREKQGDKVVEKTTNTYVRAWVKKPVDSNKFKMPGHVNPPVAMPFSDEEFFAKDVKLGAFRLSESHVKSIGGLKPFAFPADYKPPEALGGEFLNGVVYVQAATRRSALRRVSENPQVGDLRVTFTSVAPQRDISIVERQAGDTFAPWTARDGKTISLMRDGLVDASAMFASAQRSNKMMTWFLRVVGFLVMFAGLKMVLGPLTTLVDAVPILNGIVGAAAGAVAFLLAAAGSLVAIGVAWVFYRPVLGVSLLAVAGACVALVVLKKQKAAIRG